MSLSENEVRYIAHLARLAIADADLAEYTKNLANILELVAQMDTVKTQDITPMAHPQHVSQRLRADIITETDQHVLFQKIAPAVEAGLYLVPQVIE